jgi:hypothetical protein
MWIQRSPDSVSIFMEPGIFFLCIIVTIIIIIIIIIIMWAGVVFYRYLRVRRTMR